MSSIWERLTKNTPLHQRITRHGLLEVEELLARIRFHIKVLVVEVEKSIHALILVARREERVDPLV
jgi:hypothetical protein